MTITLELPPETEQSLLAQAEACGVSLDAYLQTIIANQAARESSFLKTLKSEQSSDTAVDELFDTVQIPLGVGQGAMDRENWYR